MPAAVYEGAVSRDLADLRVFNADGELVPYAWVPRRAVSRERPPAIALPMFPLYVDRDRRDVSGLALTVVRNAAGTTVSINSTDAEPATGKVLGGYVLDASALDEPLVALTFALPPTTGATTMRLAIAASDDLAAWRNIAADGTLVNIEYAGQRLTRNRIDLAAVKAKYLRLSWAADASGHRVRRGERRIRRARDRNAATMARRQGNAGRGAGGRVRVRSRRRFSRRPHRHRSWHAEFDLCPRPLLARASAAEPWQFVGSTVFYRLEQPGGDVTSAPFPVAGGERRYWLLRVDPRAGAPGEAPPLRAGWQPQEIVFAARGRAPFTLAYGNYQATGGCAADCDAGARIRQRERICWRTSPSRAPASR